MDLRVRTGACEVRVVRDAKRRRLRLTVTIDESRLEDVPGVQDLARRIAADGVIEWLLYGCCPAITGIPAPGVPPGDLTRYLPRFDGPTQAFEALGYRNAGEWARAHGLRAGQVLQAISDHWYRRGVLPPGGDARAVFQLLEADLAALPAGERAAAKEVA